MAGSVTVLIEGAENKTNLNYLVFSSLSLGSTNIVQQGSGASFNASGYSTIDLTSAPTVNDQEVLVAYQDPVSGRSIGPETGIVVV